MKTTKKTFSPKTSRVDVYEDVRVRICASLEAGSIPWRKPWSGGAGGAPRNLRSKKVYRGINVWLLALAGYSSPYWLTFRQAQDLGGSVKRGEKGTRIVFWKIGVAGARDENGKPVVGEDGRELSRKTFLLRHYTVFNLEQCEGIESPAVADETPKNDLSPIEICESIVAGYVENGGPKVERQSSSAAFYRPSTDSVRVPLLSQFESAPSSYSVLFHELIHSTGHSKRLARKGIVDPTLFGSHTYSQEELVAEFGASYLCAVAGIEVETLENSAAYIAAWLKRLREEDSAKWLVTAAAQAQKAADLILGAAFEDDSEDDDEEEGS